MPAAMRRWCAVLLALLLAAGGVALAHQINTSTSGTGPVIKTYPSTLTATYAVTGANVSYLATSAPLSTSGAVSTQLSPQIATTTDSVRPLVLVNGCAAGTRCNNIGTLTVTFNRAVTNPVIHVIGLGGSTTNGGNFGYWSAAMVLTGSTGPTGSPTLTQVGTGSGNLTVTATEIRATNNNGATACNTSPAAGCGSVRVNGTVTSLTFRLDAQLGGNQSPAFFAASNPGDAFQMTVSVDEDFGDAPSSYQASPVASHVVGGLFLGSTITADNINTTNSGALATSPIANATAASDGGDNGVVFPLLGRGVPALVDVNVSGSGGRLQGWIDWADDGNFTTAGDRIATDAIDGGSGDADGVTNGVIRLTVTPPATAALTPTIARFRISSTAGLGINGMAPDGEVEDYQVTVVNPSSDLSITKTDSVTSVLSKANTTYVITVTNNGPFAVTGAVLRDALVTNLPKTSVACGPTPGVCTPATTPTIAQLEAGYALPNLAVGATYQLSVTVRVNAATGNVSNVATIAVPTGYTDPDTSDDSATDTNAVTQVPLTPASTVMPACPGAWNSVVDWATDRPTSIGATTSHSRNGNPTTVTITDGPFANPPIFNSYTAAYAANYGGNPMIDMQYTDVDIRFARPINSLRFYFTDLDNNESLEVYGELGGVRVTPSAVDGPTSEAMRRGVRADGVLLVERVSSTVQTGDEGSAALIGFTSPVDRIFIRHNDRSYYVSVGGGTSGLTDIQACTDLTDTPASYAEALHSVVPNIRMGATNDGEATSIFSATANGDGADDNGVTIPTLRSGTAATIPVAVVQTAANQGRLQGWVDWNADGDFADAGERIATDLQLAATSGTINVPVTVPPGAALTPTMARFRWSSIAGLDANAAAFDGEVEDYTLTVQPAADLSLTKTVVNPTPPAGSQQVYILTARSAAGYPQTANGITVQDTLPAGFTFVSATGTGTYNSTTGVWTVGSLAPGAEAQITITGQVTAAIGTTVTNVAQITASSLPDPDSTVNNGVTTEDDYATASFTVAAQPTLPAPVCAAGGTQQLIVNGDFATGTGPTWPSWTATAGWVGTTSASNETDSGTGTLSQAGLTGLNFGPGAANGAVIQLSQYWRNGVSVMTKTAATLTISVAGTPYARLTTPADDTPTATITYLNGATGNLTSISEFTYAAWRIELPTSVAPSGAITFTHAPGGGVSDDFTIDNVTLYTCDPGTLTIDKSSSIISNPPGTVGGPFHIPGAVVRYCILVTNPSTATATNVAISDSLPSGTTFVPGSMRTGTSCAGATTVEDDDASDGGEADGVTMSFAANVVSGNRASLAGGTATAFVFNATVN